MLFHCKKLSASAPLRLCARSFYLLCELPERPLLTVPFRTIQKNHATCRFRAEAQGRRVNTFIKRHLLLKMLFHSKKLSASAPLREIILFTLSASRTTVTDSAIQDNPKKPCDLPFSRRGAGAQSEHIHQETSSPKNALSSQKAQRLCASARDHSIYSVSFPNDRYRKCHSGQSKKTMRLAIFAQRRRGAE